MNDIIYESELMDSSYKNMLIGAFATGAVKAGLEGYYVAANVPRGTFPYIVIHPALPALDDWIAEAGVPLAMYFAGKYLKKPMLKDMGKGGFVYGFSELLGITLYRVAMLANNTPVTSYVVRR